MRDVEEADARDRSGAVEALEPRPLAGALAQAAAERALVSASQLRLRRWEHHPFRDRIWELRENVTVYNAVYLALAEMLDLPLVTTDAKLAATGSSARVEFVGAYS